jgi:hypothetical protein
MQEHHIPDAFLVQHSCQQPGKPKPEATMWWTTVLEKVKIKLNRLQVYAFFGGLPQQHIVTVFALRSGRDLHPLPEQVETFRLRRLVFFPHMIEGADVCRIIGNENEFVSKLSQRILAQESLTLRVDVALFGLSRP